MVKVLKCQECGNEFKAYDNKKRKYCSLLCKKEANKRMNRWNQKLKKGTTINYRPKKDDSVQSVSRTAREHGMTYGQWVALEYAKQVKVGAR